MATKIEKPDWYPLEIYGKRLTTKEWLYEIWKRDKFNRDDILQDRLGAPVSMRLLPPEEIIKHFKTFVFSTDIDAFLANLKATPAQAVRHLSVSDVFRMFALITTSDWYKNHPDRLIFESAINALINNQQLSWEQKVIFGKFFDTPWHTFHEKSQDKTWYPNKEFTHLSGIPSSIDPGYAKADAAKQLKSHLTSWVGKLQDIELNFGLWQELNILAVFDLRIWLKFHGIEHTNISLHRFLWPTGRVSSKTKDYVNSDDDIDHIIALSERTVSQSVVRQLLLLSEARLHNKQSVKS